MKEIGGLQLDGPISLPLLIDQKRESDAGLVAKLAGINPVSQPDCSEGCSLVAESLYVLAQLRGMLAAKDSSVVTQKNNDSRLFVPQRSEPDVSSIAIRECDEGQLAAERTLHGASIMCRALRGVKRMPRARCGVECFDHLSNVTGAHCSLIAHKSTSSRGADGGFGLTCIEKLEGWPWTINRCLLPCLCLRRTSARWRFLLTCFRCSPDLLRRW